MACQMLTIEAVGRSPSNHSTHGVHPDSISDWFYVQHIQGDINRTYGLVDDLNMAVENKTDIRNDLLNSTTDAGSDIEDTIGAVVTSSRN